MKTKDGYILIAIGINAGFIIGLVSAFIDIASNRYLQYQMIRLLIFDLQKNLNKWVFTSIIACLIFSVLSFLLKVLWRIFLKFFEFRLKDGKLLSSRFAEKIKRQKFIFRQTKAVRKMALSVVAGLILLNIGTAIDTKTNKPDGPNIILIIVDCLRSDHLGCYGYFRNTSPAIDALAKNGILFKNAYSNAPWTKPSVASMFTSVYPYEHRAITLKDALPEGVLTIAENLKNRGYYTCFFNGGNFSIGKHYNFDQGFDYFSLHSVQTEKATGLTDNFLSHIRDIYPQRFFAYIHYMDTHVPYNRNDYNEFFATKPGTYFEPGLDYISNWHIRIMTGNDRVTDGDRKYLISLYDGQIRFVDENIKKIVEDLKNRNMLDNTLIIITSDHGEEFWEHHNYEHGHTLYNEILHVPLIISGNRLQPSEVEQCVSLIDLFPTISDMAKVRNTNLLQRGESLKNIIEGVKKDSDRPVFATATLYGDEKYCLIKDNKKLIVTTFRNNNKEKLFGYSAKDKLELYDLDSDPFEKNNLKNIAPKAVSGYKAELEKFKNLTAGFRDVKIEINKELKNKLKAIGYLIN